MIFGWFKRRRRRKLLARRLSPQWVQLVEGIEMAGRLDRDERSKLIDLARVIVAEKLWTGCGELEVTDEIKWTIAAQAAMLILHIEHDYFATVHEVLVYPSTMRVPQPVREGVVVTQSDAAVLGLASHRGPIVLAWDAVQRGAANADDGHNVVLHEFAHNLDFMDHAADGTPPLSSRQMYRDWYRIMTREYEALVEDAERGRAKVLDTYGATNAAEFFAVSTEAFFEKPRQLKQHHAALYGLLSDYYQQNPAHRS
ncbi:zinc-dependent peptidase [Planctomycetales bacterium ZRK34]|nr:zinc-dependent peptidase [Planctomycetales bacterium ZRK34]